MGAPPRAPLSALDFSLRSHNPDRDEDDEEEELTGWWEPTGPSTRSTFQSHVASAKVGRNAGLTEFDDTRCLQHGSAGYSGNLLAPGHQAVHRTAHELFAERAKSAQELVAEGAK